MLTKIKTKTELEKQRKKNNIVLGVILISLMLFSSLGYAFFSGDSNTSKKKYNNFNFIESNGLWATEVGNRVFYFTYLPQEVDNISIKGTYNLQDYSEKPIYFINTNEAIGEILRTLGDYVLRYQEACLENCTNENIPQKTCEDNLIIFKDSQDLSSSSQEIATEVYKDKNCIYITGDFIKASDAFLYKLLGIIK